MFSWLIINNFCYKSISDLREVSKQFLEMIFPHLYTFFLAGSFCYVLTFDPAPKKCYSKVMHRKEVTHSNGQ